MRLRRRCSNELGDSLGSSRWRTSAARIRRAARARREPASRGLASHRPAGDGVRGAKLRRGPGQRSGRSRRPASSPRPLTLLEEDLSKSEPCVYSRLFATLRKDPSQRDPMGRDRTTLFVRLRRTGFSAITVAFRPGLHPSGCTRLGTSASGGLSPAAPGRVGALRVAGSHQNAGSLRQEAGLTTPHHGLCLMCDSV